MDETGAKINVPPLSVQQDEIVVSGEKEGVLKCKATIMRIYEEKVLHTLNFRCDGLAGNKWQKCTVSRKRLWVSGILYLLIPKLVFYSSEV